MVPVFLNFRLFLHLDYFTLHWIRMLLQRPLSWLQYQVGRPRWVRRRGLVILWMPSIWCNSKSLWNDHFDKWLPLHQLLSTLLKVSPRLICQASWHTNCAIASNVAFDQTPWSATHSRTSRTSRRTHCFTMAFSFFLLWLKVSYLVVIAVRIQKARSTWR